MNTAIVDDREIELGESVLTHWQSYLIDRSFACSTIENYLSAVRIYFRWTTGVRDGKGRASTTVSAWFAELQRTSAVGTQRTYWTAMHAFWLWAVESGLVARDPMLGMSPPRPHVPVLDEFRGRRWTSALPQSTSAAS